MKTLHSTGVLGVRVMLHRAVAVYNSLSYRRKQLVVVLANSAAAVVIGPHGHAVPSQTLPVIEAGRLSQDSFRIVFEVR